MQKTLIKMLISTLTLAPVACDRSDDPADVAEVEDSRDFYRAFAFGYGPVLDRVPEIRDRFAIDTMVEEEEAAAVRATTESIIVTIDELDPEFMDEFAKELQSGDPVRIDAAITRASEMTRDAIVAHESLGEIHAAYEEQGSSGPAPGGGDRVKARDSVQNLDSLVHERVAAVTTVLAVAEYWVLFQYKYLFQYSGGASAMEDGLFRDELVSSIATNLHRPELTAP